MLSKSDIQGRLRLFRYGLVVVVVVTFVVAFLVQYVYAAPYAAEWNEAAAAIEANNPGTTIARAPFSVSSVLINSVIATVIVAVIMVIVYFIYQMVLKRGAAPEGNQPQTT